MKIFDRCCAIAVIQNKKILLGERTDGQGWSMAGGKLEEGEDYETAAKRELNEEFDIFATTLNCLGAVTSEVYIKGKKSIVRPTVFLCKDYTGIPKPYLPEMKELRWIGLNELSSVELFKPTKEIIDLYGDVLFK
ncbi:NUDIX hydrolase [Crassaminicella thermophila]|uniref:NUDIX hydrolase n=1 Tax=Crassaminicella thermophila TaxID=2599308 RepID=A0A5C0SEJ5_CRATE|nr:NUDIX hydrolase [Crassaminicella thermophila]QEK11399.1 NUDIX hydrolase [Crassaminicella thermophila]